MGKCVFFLFLHESICCWYSLEALDEMLYMFPWSNISYLELVSSMVIHSYLKIQQLSLGFANFYCLLPLAEVTISSEHYFRCWCHTVKLEFDLKKKKAGKRK